MTSIKDVAKLAGVSVMTVSRVINSRETVTMENRNRVQAAIKKLSYRPSRMARTLRSQRSHILGLMLPNIENPIFAALAKYVEEEAHRFGYNIMVANTWEDRGAEAKSLELMLSLHIDGIIVSPVSSANDKLIAMCTMPMVILDRSSKKDGKVPVVSVDNILAGTLAARHLLSLGHRHFACLAGPKRINVFSDRLEGYRRELLRNGFSLNAVESVSQIGSVSEAEKAMAKLLAGCATRPLALFCASSDLVAIGAIKEATRRGLTLPEDLSIVGVDDIPAADWITPALTTIRQPFDAVAAAGVKVLVQMIENEDSACESHILRPEIVIRDSTTAYVAR